MSVLADSKDQEISIQAVSVSAKLKSCNRGVTEVGEIL